MTKAVVHITVATRWYLASRSYLFQLHTILEILFSFRLSKQSNPRLHRHLIISLKLCDCQSQITIFFHPRQPLFIVQVECTVQQCSQVPRSIKGRYHAREFIGGVRSASQCWVSFAWQTELWEPSGLDSRWQTPTGAGQKFCLWRPFSSWPSNSCPNCSP